MAYRNRPGFRPENALEGTGPRFGEYPVNLLTRRAYGLRTDAVIDRRDAAPNSIWLDFRTHPDAWQERCAMTGEA
jgi:hypothetical protein